VLAYHANFLGFSSKQGSTTNTCRPPALQRKPFVMLPWFLVLHELHLVQGHHHCHVSSLSDVDLVGIPAHACQSC
jgi:hypothetical protein